MTYDAWHRLITTTDANGDTVQTRYDLVGNRRFLTDPVGNISEWRLDALDRVVAEIDPQLATRSYVYDLANNLLQQTRSQWACH